METQIEIKELSSFKESTQVPYYQILLFDKGAQAEIDFTSYSFSSNAALFLTPYQLLTWKTPPSGPIKVLRFHGDFYCIEYHKKEVACNGILFNNIYQTPLLTLSPELFEQIRSLFLELEAMEKENTSFDLSVKRSYLQLILALSSREKQKELKEKRDLEQTDPFLEFQELLEKHLMESRPLSFYSEKFGVSENVLSKKVKKLFGKSPLRLIQERRVLEAKKLLHLTHYSIKEISHQMGFQDEYYFSRFFKNEVGAPPKEFREKVGISIVAEKSME